MRRWRTTILVLVTWTVAVVAIWMLANAALRSGVSDADIEECREEGFFPPEECEDSLRNLAADSDRVIGVGGLLVIWALVVILFVVLTRPAPHDDA